MGLATVSRHLPKREPGDGERQRWITFLRNHKAGESAPGYLIYDNDSIFSDKVTEAIEHLGMEPKQTAHRSPWRNGVAERWVGSAHRELLNRVIVFDEQYLRRLLRDYVAYYDAERVHTHLKDPPAGRPTETRPSPDATVVGLPRVGGLYHRYVWQDAA